MNLLGPLARACPSGCAAGRPSAGALTGSPARALPLEQTLENQADRERRGLEIHGSPWRYGMAGPGGRWTVALTLTPSRVVAHLAGRPHANADATSLMPADKSYS